MLKIGIERKEISAKFMRVCFVFFFFFFFFFPFDRLQRILKDLISDFYLTSLQLVLCRVAAVKRLPVHQPWCSLYFILAFEISENVLRNQK